MDLLNVYRSTHTVQYFEKAFVNNRKRKKNVPRLFDRQRKLKQSLETSATLVNVSIPKMMKPKPFEFIVSVNEKLSVI